MTSELRQTHSNRDTMDLLDSSLEHTAKLKNSMIKCKKLKIKSLISVLLVGSPFI
jgi:hypothetical protein